jgi:secreted trypsin-like serine protease
MVRRTVSKYFWHPSYSGMPSIGWRNAFTDFFWNVDVPAGCGFSVNGSAWNDIALLKLSSPVALTPVVIAEQAAPTPPSASFVEANFGYTAGSYGTIYGSSTGVISGWGYHDFWASLRQSHLLVGTMTNVPLSWCSGFGSVPTTQLCMLGAAPDNHKALPGDSGGPWMNEVYVDDLVSNVTRIHHQLAGIASQTDVNAGSGYSLYTNVTLYRSWIDSMMYCDPAFHDPCSGEHEPEPCLLENWETE